MIYETIKGNPLFGTEDEKYLKLEILDATTKAKVKSFYIEIDDSFVMYGGPKGYILFETIAQIKDWEQNSKFPAFSF